MEDINKFMDYIAMIDSKAISQSCILKSLVMDSSCSASDKNSACQEIDRDLLVFTKGTREMLRLYLQEREK